MYLDESGDPGSKPGSSENFAVGGVVVPAHSWNDVDSAYRSHRKSIRDNFGIPFHVELHGRELTSSRGRIGGQQMKLKHRRAIFRECLNFLGRLNQHGVGTFAVHIYKAKLYAAKWKFPYQMQIETFKWVFQRYSDFVTRGNERVKGFNDLWRKAYRDAYDSAPPEDLNESFARRHGIIFADETNSLILSRALSTIREGEWAPNIIRGTQWRQDRVTIEQPLVRKSDQCPCIQMADWFVTALRLQTTPSQYHKKHQMEDYFERFLRPLFLTSISLRDPRSQGVYYFPTT